ncbi:MAG: substrate-binding domain-containing protein [Ardenticatenaceae bacterium]|nr:substrate-binding domain-containing protein [Ardenticatenaceae bacterium]
MKNLEVLKINPDTDVPLAVQLKQQLVWLIASRQIEMGERLPPVRELATHLGINLHTVRAAYRKIEEDGLVATRQGLGTVVLGFDHFQIAQQAANVRTYTIGLIVPDINNPFYPALARGVEDVARENHVLVFICNTDEDPATGQAYLDLLIAKQVDGLIVAPYGLGFRSQPGGEGAHSGRAPIPIVYVDRPGETGHTVLLDSEGAGRAATAHLIEHRHRRIGLITCSLETPTLQQCYLGYERALNSAGVAVDPSIIIVAPAFTVASGYEAAKQLLEKPAPPAAIFAVGDTLAIGAMRAIKEHGLRVPEDIALIGYNDIEMAAVVEPPLTTVAAPTHELGATAMQMLQRLVAGEMVEERQITLPTELVVRRTCGCGGDH